MSHGARLAQGIPQSAAKTTRAAPGRDADSIFNGDASAEGGEGVFRYNRAARQEQVPLVPETDDTQEYPV